MRALGAVVVVVEDGDDGGVLLHGGPGRGVPLDPHAVGAVVALVVAAAPVAPERAEQQLPHSSATDLFAQGLVKK